MWLRRMALVLSMVCVVSISGLGLSSGPAAAKPYITCDLDPFGEPPGFSDAHCLSPSANGPWRYSSPLHLFFTWIFGSNAGTASGTTAAAPTKLTGTAAGVITEIQCTTASGTGSMENVEEGGETFAKGTGKITYTGCSVTKPAGKGCVVTGGEVKTNELAANNKGLTNELKITPATEGANFAEIPISSCSISGLNNTFPVSGSFIALVNGATTTTTHAAVTAQGTFKFAGQKAGPELAMTLRGENENPLVPE